MPGPEHRFSHEGHTTIDDPMEAQQAEQYVYLMEHVNDVVEPLQIEVDTLQPSVLDEDPAAMEAWKQTDAEIRKIIKIIEVFPAEHELRQKFAVNEEAVKHLLRSYLGKKKAYERQKKQEELSKTTPLFDTSELIPDELRYENQPPPETTMPPVPPRPSEAPGAGGPPPASSKTMPPSPAARVEEKETGREDYDAEVSRLAEEVLQIERLLESRGGEAFSVKRYSPDGTVRETVQLDVTEEMLQVLQSLESYLPQLDEKYDVGPLDDKPEMRMNVERRIRELGETWRSKRPMPRPQRPRRSDPSAAWMPRVPVAPYRARMVNAGRRRYAATLAEAPTATNESAATPVFAPPDRAKLQLPENFDTMDEKEKTDAMQALLENVRSEKERILAEHEAVINQLTEQIKERKLEALRASLDQ